MTASERLAALDGKDWPALLPPLFDVLPEIVAVVRAMEQLMEDGTAPIADEIVYVIRANTRDQIKDAVAALDAKLAG